MTEALSTLADYLSFPFVRYALAVGILVALCAALLGVPLVLKRCSMIGDGLSHVAFGAMAVATATGMVAPMAVVLPVTVLAAVLLLRLGQSAAVKGDAAIAMLSVGALAIGYLALQRSGTANVNADACDALFGSSSILNLGRADLLLSLFLSLFAAGCFLLFYPRVFAITFDENFAASAGIRVSLYNLGLAVLTGVVVVISMHLVGALLISALVVLPALSAMRICKTFRTVTLAAVIFSVCGAALGILASILFETPVGATVVVTDLVIFLLCCGAGILTRRR